MKIEVIDIWKEHKDHIHNYVAQKVEASIVEDLVQDVFAELCESYSKNKEIRNPRNWLFQVSRNLISDHYQEKIKTAENEQTFISLPVEEYKNCLCDIAEESILQLLPNEYALPLILSDIKNIPQKEIAAELGLNYTNTKSRIQRARKKLKEVIEANTEFTYNKHNEPVSGKLKNGHSLPLQMVEMIKKLELED